MPIDHPPVSDNPVLQLCDQLQQMRYGQQPDDARYYERPLQNTSVSLCIADPLTNIRTDEIASVLPADYCSVIMVSHGQGYWVGNGQIHHLQPCSLLLIRASSPFSFSFPSAYAALSFNFPAALLPWDPQRPDSPHHGSLLCLSSGQAARLRCLLTLALHHPRRSAIEYQLFRLLSRLETARPPGVKQLQQQIQQQLQQHGDCNINTLVTATGWSRRYLFKLFQSQQHSLSQYIQLQKLGQAFDRLTARQYSHLSINDIAMDAGFATQAHFARCFRQQFAMTPSQLREQLQQTLAENWQMQLA